MQGQARHGATGLQQVKVQRLPRVSSPAPAPYTEGSRAVRSRLQAAAGPDSSSGVQAKATALRVQDATSSWSAPAQDGGQQTASQTGRNNGVSSNSTASEQAPGSGILGQVDVCIVQTLPAVVSTDTHCHQHPLRPDQSVPQPANVARAAVQHIYRLSKLHASL